MSEIRIDLIGLKVVDPKPESKPKRLKKAPKKISLTNKEQAIFKILLERDKTITSLKAELARKELQLTKARKKAIEAGIVTDLQWQEWMRVGIELVQK